MGVDSCSEGRRFEYRHRLLDGHFYQMLRLRQRLKLFGQSLHNVDVIKLFDGRNQILYPQN